MYAHTIACLFCFEEKKGRPKRQSFTYSAVLMMTLPSYQKDMLLPTKEAQQRPPPAPPLICVDEYDHDTEGDHSDDDEENLPLMESQRVSYYYGNDDDDDDDDYETPQHHPSRLLVANYSSSQQQQGQEEEEEGRQRTTRWRRRRPPIRIISPESICLLLLVGMAICVSYTTSKNDSRMTSWGDTNTGLLSRLLGNNSNKGRTNKDDDQLPSWEGTSSAAAVATNRLVVDDTSYIDIPNVSCDDIYYNELFDYHNYITFQHTLGVYHDDVTPVIVNDDGDGEDGHSHHIYELNDAGGLYTTTVYVDNDDRNRIYNIVQIDGFGRFDTYHEQFQFVNLPLKINESGRAASVSNGRNVQMNENVDDHTTKTSMTDAIRRAGCRVFHTIIAVFSEHASTTTTTTTTITREEWYATRDDDEDQEMRMIYKLFTNQKR